MTDFLREEKERIARMNVETAYDQSVFRDGKKPQGTAEGGKF